MSGSLVSGEVKMQSMVADAVLKPGRYRHYKGRDYIVLGIARHSETQEELVVYRQDYGERGLWVRPLPGGRSRGSAPRASDS